MINPLYEEFPESIEIDGTEYEILTDFREWIRFSDMLGDDDLSDEEKLYLMTNWLTEAPRKITAELVNALFTFFRADALNPDPAESGDEDEHEPPPKRPPVFDWKYDAKFLIGDFRRYYGINLLSFNMHWWEFLCLFAALPEDSQCRKRIDIRSTDLSKIKDKERRNQIAAVQRIIALPFEMDDDDMAAVFEGGG